MNLKRVMVYLCGVLLITVFMQTRIWAQEDQKKQEAGTGGNDIESLSRELAANLNLSDSQQSRIKSILNEFQNELSGTARIGQTVKPNESPEIEHTNKAKADKTEVRDQNNRAETTGNTDVNTGKAKTKNETNDNVTGRSTHMAVSFERARIDADSRIEDILTPEQAIQYGKIKSDWWDKIREKVQPGNNIRK